MKIRMGFVSNSSSSSFLCIGWKMNTPTECLKKLIEEFGGVKKEKMLKLLEEETEYDVIEALNKEIKNLSLHYIEDYKGSYYIIGAGYEAWDSEVRSISLSAIQPQIDKLKPFMSGEPQVFFGAKYT